jgi:hypothetical protein
VYNTILVDQKGVSVKAVVVYESIWGCTKAVAQAIAQGIGPDVPVLSTTEATKETIADVDLLVAGGPVHGFTLASERSRAGIRVDPKHNDPPADLAHPPLRTWLDALLEGKDRGRSAAFETRLRGPLGHATKVITEGLERAGYRPLAEPAGFLVKAKRGCLRDGELDRAREWGAELARALQ